MIAQIYLITFTNGKVYVGGTTTTNRKDSHFASLLKGTHSNHRMQFYYDALGCPKFTVLEEFDAAYREDVCEREIHWIKTYWESHHDDLLNLSHISLSRSFPTLPRRCPEIECVTFDRPLFNCPKKTDTLI